VLKAELGAQELHLSIELMRKRKEREWTSVDFVKGDEQILNEEIRSIFKDILVLLFFWQRVVLSNMIILCLDFSIIWILGKNAHFSWCCCLEHHTCDVIERFSEGTYCIVVALANFKNLS